MPDGIKEPQIRSTLKNLWSLHPALLLHEAAIATVTNYGKLDGLKQQIFIILQTCRSEVWDSAHGLISRCLQGFIPSVNSGRESVSCLS